MVLSVILALNMDYYLHKFLNRFKFLIVTYSGEAGISALKIFKKRPNFDEVQIF
jgi:hypothetical protein